MCVCGGVLLWVEDLLLIDNMSEAYRVSVVMNYRLIMALLLRYIYKFIGE